MTTTAPAYLARISFHITDMCEGRAVGTLIRDVNVRLSENSEACARKAFADYLENTTYGDVSIFKYVSHVVLKKIK